MRGSYFVTESEDRMLSELQDLAKAVKAEPSHDAAARLLLTGIRDQVQKRKTDPVELTELKEWLGTEADDLVNALSMKANRAEITRDVDPAAHLREKPGKVKTA